MIGGSIKMMQYVLCMCMIAGAYLRSVLSYACMHLSELKVKSKTRQDDLSTEADQILNIA